MDISRTLPMDSRNTSHVTVRQPNKITQSENPFQDPSYVVSSVSNVDVWDGTHGRHISSQLLPSKNTHGQAFKAPQPVPTKSERPLRQPLEASEPRHRSRPSDKSDSRQLKQTSEKARSGSLEATVTQDVPYSQSLSDQYARPVTAPQATSSAARRQVHRQTCKTCGRALTIITDNGTVVRYAPTADYASCCKQQLSMNQTFEDMVSSPQTRSVSAGAVPSLRPASSSDASASGNVAHQKPCCNKCGRNRRHDQPSRTPQDNSPSATKKDDSPALLSRTTPDRKTKTRAARTPPTSSQKALSKIQAASTEARPDRSYLDVPVVCRPDQPNVQEPPLLDRRGLKSLKLFRSASISSSISRTFSRRKKTGPEPPFSANAISSKDQRRPSGLLRRISRAIRSGNDQKRAGIKTTDPVPDRPSSPYSFTGRPDEEEAFEMNDIRVSKLEPDYNKEMLDAPLSAPVIVEPVQEPTTKPSHIRAKSEAWTTTLAVPGRDFGTNGQNQQPPLSRLKSMRGGVNRMASVTRSTSMKRFNSLKRTPELWYRSDMSFEGAVAVY